MFKRNNTVICDFCGVSPKSPLRLIHCKPAKWRYAKVHRDVVRVERMDYCQGFLMIYNQGDAFVKNMQESESIGCKDFAEKGLDRFNTDKGYFRDLFS